MIKRMNLSEQIYQALKADILEQRIAFGEKMANRELQERFGVSSTPIRDAINRLYTEGFVDDITNVGARVIAFDVRMALDVNQSIAALHREAAAMCIDKGNRDELIRALRRSLNGQIEAIDADAYFMHDRMFHQAFFDCCGNACWKKIFLQHSGLWELLVLCYHKYEDSDRQRAIADHQRIVSACAQGDIAAAQRHIKAHFDGAVEPLTQMTS